LTLIEDKQSLLYVTKKLKELIQWDQVCCICMNDICTTITHCGHSFCQKCIVTHLSNARFCPSCKNELVVSSLLQVVNNEMCPSKLHMLVQHICSTDEKIILFAQYKSILRDMKNMLCAFNVNALLLEGNTVTRMRILKEFEENGKILLVSLQDSFAGLRFPNVKQIIFAHALLGSPQALRILESQAVARTIQCDDFTNNVQVSYFVCADSLEEIAWNHRNL